MTSYNINMIQKYHRCLSIIHTAIGKLSFLPLGSQNSRHYMTFSSNFHYSWMTLEFLMRYSELSLPHLFPMASTEIPRESLEIKRGGMVVSRFTASFLTCRSLIQYFCRSFQYLYIYPVCCSGKFSSSL